MTKFLAASLLVALALASPVRSQGLAGRAVRVGGEAWAGVDVHLISLPWRYPVDPELALASVVATGESGRFEAQLAPGRSYTAWAVSPVKDGRYTISSAVGGVSAGQELELAEAERAQRVVAVDVVGIEAWKDEGPFTYQVACLVSDKVVVACELDESGRPFVPPMPDAATFLVRSAAGVVIASGTIPLGVDERQRAAQEPRGSDAATDAGSSFVTISEEMTRVTVPPPVPLSLQVEGARGAARGAPLYWSDGIDRVLVSEVDKKGRATIAVPAEWSERGKPYLRHASLWIEAPGCSSVEWFADDFAILDEKGEALLQEIELPRGHTLSGKLFLARGKPAANVPILIHTGAPSGIDFRGDRASFDGKPRVVRTDAKGNFEIDGLAPHVSWQLSTLLDAEAAFLGTSDYPVASAVVLASGENSSKKKHKLGSIVLDAYRPIDVTVLGDTGEPAAADITCREALDAAMQEEHVVDVRVGPTGRIRLLARAKSTLHLAARDARSGSRFAEQSVEVGKGKGALEVTLRP